MQVVQEVIFFPKITRDAPRHAEFVANFCLPLLQLNGCAYKGETQMWSNLRLVLWNQGRCCVQPMSHILIMFDMVSSSLSSNLVWFQLQRIRLGILNMELTFAAGMWWMCLQSKNSNVALHEGGVVKSRKLLFAAHGSISIVFDLATLLSHWVWFWLQGNLAVRSGILLVPLLNAVLHIKYTGKLQQHYHFQFCSYVFTFFSLVGSKSCCQ